MKHKLKFTNAASRERNYCNPSGFGHQVICGRFVSKHLGIPFNDLPKTIELNLVSRKPREDKNYVVLSNLKSDPNKISVNNKPRLVYYDMYKMLANYIYENKVTKLYAYITY